MHLERPNRGDDDGRLRVEISEPALDVEEFLGAQVGAEAGFGEHDLPERQTQPGGHQRIAAVGKASAPTELTIDAPDLQAAPASGPRVMRRRLDGGPMAPLKLASGCDRRCAFCAIPAFRGAFVSRRPTEVLGEAHWLAENGVREVFLVSENSTSYGKDLGDLRLLETLVGEIAAVPGLTRVRVSYLQPAEMRPTLISAMTSTPGVVPYFDLRSSTRPVRCCAGCAASATRSGSSS